MFLGVLLARGGVDFRGDTVQPPRSTSSTTSGSATRSAAPARRDRRLGSAVKGVPSIRFDDLPLRRPYIAFVPQWDLLNLLAEEGRRQPRLPAVASWWSQTSAKAVIASPLV
jgi:hypothetical protein